MREGTQILTIELPWPVVEAACQPGCCHSSNQALVSWSGVSGCGRGRRAMEQLGAAGGD